MAKIKQMAKQEAVRLALPEYAYVPGHNPRPPDGFLDHVIDRAPNKTESASAANNIAWHSGLRLLREGYFWETHEVLEAVWMRAAPNSREKHLVRGIIHLANAALKRRMDRPQAARRLETLAKESLRDAYPGNSPLPVMDLSRDDVVALANLSASS